MTQQSWDPSIDPPQPGGLTATTTFIGDYFGGAMTNDDNAHLLFVSTSPSLQPNLAAYPGAGTTTSPQQQQIYATVPAP